MSDQPGKPEESDEKPGEADDGSAAAGPPAAQAPPAGGGEERAAPRVPAEPRRPLLQRLGQHEAIRLHKLLGHRFYEVAMAKDRQLMVDECVHELQCVVLCAFPECKVRSFGSTQNGFSTYDSDLDATLTQQGVKQVEAKYAAAVLQQYLLPLLAKSGRFEIAGTIAEARIPILKLRYWGNQLEVLDVDLSCHNTEAFPNTQLLLAYSRMGEGIIAALGILVKLWAKSAGVSGAPQKHLSSYSIILMVLYFLQVVHNVPCLPTWAFDGSTEVPPEGRQHWKWTGPMTLLLWEFFKFYAMDFQWGTEVVAMHIGQRTVNSDERHKDLRGRWASRLHVEDPVLTSRNLNAPLGPEQEEQLRRALWDAALALQNGQLPVGLTPVSCELAPAPRDPPGAGAAWHGVPRGPGVQAGFPGGSGRPVQQGMPWFPYGGAPGAVRGPSVPPSALARGPPPDPGSFPVAPVGGGGPEGAQGLVRPAAPRGGPSPQPARPSAAAPLPPGGPAAAQTKEPPPAAAAWPPQQAGGGARGGLVSEAPARPVAGLPEQAVASGRAASGPAGVGGDGSSHSSRSRGRHSGYNQRVELSPTHVVWRRPPQNGRLLPNAVGLVDELAPGARHLHGDPVPFKAPAAENVPMPCLSTISLKI